MSDNVDKFYRAVPPPKSVEIILKEKPWHRVAAYCAACGTSDSQIARVVGHSRQAVWELRQQSWFQERVARIINDNGGAIAREMLAEASPLAVQKLTELMQSPDEQVAARAASDVLKCAIGNKLNVSAETPPPLDMAQIKAKERQMIEEIAAIDPSYIDDQIAMLNSIRNKGPKSETGGS